MFKFPSAKFEQKARTIVRNHLAKTVSRIGVLSGLTILITTYASVTSAQSAAKAATGRVVYASTAGAALDSNLKTGGGTDDTAALQKILNRAESGTPLHLIIDGPALVSGLNVYSNTTLECIDGGGLFLKEGSNRAIVRNVHRSRDAIIDEHITIRGCFLHGNKNGQLGAMRTASWEKGGKPHQFRSNQEADGSYMAGLQILGVNYLTVENVTIWNVRAFSSHVANANRVDFRNVIADNGIKPGDHWYNMDGFHFNGPLRNLTIDGLKAHTYDDGLTLAANDATDDLRINNEMGPYVGQGPIMDVTVNNVQFMDSLRGIRLLSSTQRLDRVAINNVTGTVQTQLVLISNGEYEGRGDFGSITLTNVVADGIKPFVPLAKIWGGNVLRMLEQPEKYPNLAAELGGLDNSLFVINARVETLNLRNVITRVHDSRPAIWVGPTADIKMLNASFSIFDPERLSLPLRQDKGSRIERMNLQLDR